jgi:hypothetical protein
MLSFCLHALTHTHTHTQDSIQLLFRFFVSSLTPFSTMQLYQLLILISVLNRVSFSIEMPAFPSRFSVPVSQMFGGALLKEVLIVVWKVTWDMTR